jgi:hypothetical protein
MHRDLARLTLSSAASRAGFDYDNERAAVFQTADCLKTAAFGSASTVGSVNTADSEQNRHVALHAGRFPHSAPMVPFA